MPGKAQTVGNSFRTIGINIAKMANSSDEWVAANGRVNVALKDSQGNLRSTYDIMKDLYTGVDGQSVAWKDLSEAEQNAIAVQAAGKHEFCLYRLNCGKCSKILILNWNSNIQVA